MSRSPADLLEISYTRATSASQNYTTEWPSAHPITASSADRGRSHTQ